MPGNPTAIPSKSPAASRSGSPALPSRNSAYPRSFRTTTAGVGPSRSAASWLPDAQWAALRAPGASLPFAFAAKGGRNDVGSFVFSAGGELFLDDFGAGRYEGGFEPPRDPVVALGPGSIAASLPWASGCIADLGDGSGAASRLAELHRPDPNLNVMHPRGSVPILRGRIAKGRVVLAYAVFAW
jgi:hypothetical protein